MTLPRDLHRVSAWRGWQRRKTPGQASVQPADQGVDAVPMYTPNATDCSLISSQHFLSLCLDVSHPLVSPDHYSSAYIPACSGGFFRDRLVSDDMKLP